jgi:hypothetical protein
VNAFANSKIDEPVYCKLPPGRTGPDVVLRLLKALYELKRSSALWHAELTGTLEELGLQPLSGVECVYTSPHMIAFFVDDIFVTHDRRHTAEVDAFESKLFSKYEMKNLGQIEWFLGIRVSRNRKDRKLWLSQDSYIDKLAAKFNVNADGAKQSPLPVEDLLRYLGTASPQEILLFQQKVGSINFAAMITRADIALAASKLSEHLTNSSPRHLELVSRILGYLLATRTYSICFDGQHTDLREIVLASSDASHADDPLTRYSSQGYGFELYGGSIDWKANKQKTVTLSLTEAELLAVSQTARETLWWNRLFESLEFDSGHKIAIQCDNTQTIRALTSESPRFTTKLRHIDIHSHWLRQEIRAGNITMQRIESARTLADGFTKPLPIQRHKDFVNLLGLTPLPVVR